MALDDTFDRMQEHQTVGAVMTNPVETVPPSAPLGRVIERMASRGISCVIVEQDGRPVGILSERDVVRVLHTQGCALNALDVAQVMVQPVHCITADALLEEAIEKMQARGIRRLPVVDASGRLLGLVTQTDVLSGLKYELNGYAKKLKVMVQRRTARLRTMRNAAHAVARLGRELKSLNLDELLDIAASRIPALMRARQACFAIPNARGQVFAARHVGAHNCRKCFVGRVGKLVEDVVVELDEAADLFKVMIHLELPMFNESTGELEKGKAHGGICLEVPRAQADRKTLTYIAAMVRNTYSASIANALAFDAIRRVSRTDALTGLYRRFVFEEALQSSYRIATRYGRCLTVALIDVDRFKSINDRWGHAAGDAALVVAARVLRESVRDVDVVARYGGDEFAVLFPETCAEPAAKALERVCENIRRAEFGHPELSITFSVGVAELGRNESVQQLMERADAALYRAKREGRDRICVAPMPASDLHTQPPVAPANAATPQ